MTSSALQLPYFPGAGRCRLVVTLPSRLRNRGIASVLRSSCPTAPLQDMVNAHRITLQRIASFRTAVDRQLPFDPSDTCT